jgi:glycosidase
MLFSSEADGVCLYQGQELGLKNPTSIELPDSMLLELDAQTSMRAARGESIDKLRLTSRANARVPLPLDEYKRQFSDPNSYYNLPKNFIDEWKTG